MRTDQRIAEQPLEGSARDGQSAADQQRHEHARQADIEHDRLFHRFPMRRYRQRLARQDGKRITGADQVPAKAKGNHRKNKRQDDEGDRQEGMLGHATGARKGYGSIGHDAPSAANAAGIGVIRKCQGRVAAWSCLYT